MTRDEILKRYDVRDDGVIVSPGKFEGEMLYAPYFYDCMCNGFADESGSTEDGTPDIFTVTDEDRTVFPELGNTICIELYESDQGFVHLEEFTE